MFVKSNDINMVLEFCPIDLQAVIKSHVPLQAEDIKSYMQMTLRGVDACHKAWVLHRVSNDCFFTLDMYIYIYMYSFMSTASHHF